MTKLSGWFRYCALPMREHGFNLFVCSVQMFLFGVIKEAIFICTDSASLITQLANIYLHSLFIALGYTLTFADYVYFF